MMTVAVRDGGVMTVAVGGGVMTVAVMDGGVMTMCDEWGGGDDSEEWRKR